MDRFGQELIMQNDKITSLPRLPVCTTGYVTVQTAIVEQDNSYTYTIRPRITHKHYNEEESLTKIKELIWYTCLNFGTFYKYIEDCHYPDIFRVNVIEQLKMHIPNKGEMDVFIERVRNAMFDRVMFSCPQHLIIAANSLNDSVLKINTTKCYIPVENYKRDLEIEYKDQ